MAVLKGINLGFRFLLELCLLAALGSWGFSQEGTWALRIGAGLGAPLLAAAIWGRFVAPRASRRLGRSARIALELALFTCGAIALASAGRQSLAVALLGAFLLHRLLYTIWDQTG